MCLKQNWKSSKVYPFADEGETMLNECQKVSTKIRRRVLWRLIFVYTICSNIKGYYGTNAT